MLFTGLGTNPATAGLSDLSVTLSAAFHNLNRNPPFSTDVFAYRDLERAFRFINAFTDLGCVVLIGHSFGGDAAIKFAKGPLANHNIDIDLLIQLDSVGIGDEELPNQVSVGTNYFQISPSPFQVQGAKSVSGSTNVHVEAHYNVDNTVITHTTIDDALFGFPELAYLRRFQQQPDLHAVIKDKVAEACMR